ncbi:TolC family protein [Flavobacterium sp. CLA17]|uniref:TolC family protein n=1 Tax=Flavobacterium sp. CLA17 TaxID=2724135 RepID=UPI001492FFEF|nr:TolC family protein [Flavobacterium sp. CLA17]QSB25686.1 TolC family protein [Flavobacterium sp. CLA17]
MFRTIFTSSLLLVSLNVFSQKTFHVDDFINNSENSLENSKNVKNIKINKNENDLFNKGFLPEVSLNFSFPSYNRSITEITQPDGTYAFKESNSANSKVSLSVSQKIPFTGGKLTISNSLNRLDLFGDTQNSTSYSASWLGFNLSQPLTFFNAMKWDKKIQDAKFEYNTIIDIRNRIGIKKKAIKHYFELLRIKNEESLLVKRIEATNKYKKYIFRLIKAGKAIASDSIDVELKLLNEQKNLRFLDKSEILKIQSVNTFFKEELFNKTDSMAIPTTNIALKELNFYINNYLDVYNIVEKNNLLSYEKNIKQLERNRFYAATLSIGAGFNNTSDKYTTVFQNPNESQNFSIALNFPVLDFGKKRMELELTRTQYDVEILNLEQEKTLNIERISLLHEEINDLQYSLGLENLRTNLLRIKLNRMEMLLYAQKILFQDYAETEDLFFKSLNEKTNLTQNIYNKCLELEETTLTEIIKNEN